MQSTALIAPHTTYKHTSICHKPPKRIPQLMMLCITEVANTTN